MIDMNDLLGYLLVNGMLDDDDELFLKEEDEDEEY
jgi:hypothetical protein